MLTPIIDLYSTYYDQTTTALYSSFPVWRQWIETITEMEPILRCGNDGILYLEERTER